MAKSTRQTPETDLNTEQRILNAARRVFTRRGFDGARMEEIATEAGMNRALLHYYFRSKQKLYDMIFEDNFRLFYENLIGVINTEMSIEEKVRRIVHSEIDMLMANPDLPLFMISEAARKPELIKEKMKQTPNKQFLRNFLMQVETEIKKGTIRKIDPPTLLMNIMALCIFPFVGKPMLMNVTGMDQKQFEALMQKRKQYVADMLIATFKK